MNILMKKANKFVAFVFLILSGLVVMTDTLSAAEGSGSDNPFVVGMECSYAPHNWTSPTASPSAVAVEGGQYCDGFDVMIARKIADGLGRRLVIDKVGWEALVPSLQSKQIDAIIAGMSPTPERRKEIAFTDIYHRGTFGVVVNKSGNYANAKSVHDFHGAKMTAQLGTFHVNLIAQLDGAEEWPPMKDFPTMTVATKSKEIDGFVADKSTGATIASQNNDLEFILLDGEGGFQTTEESSGTAIGVRKEDETLRNQINAILATISQDERTAMMDEAIALQPTEHETDNVVNQSFFGQIGSLWNQYSGMFLTGTATTVLISVIATTLGIFLGLLMAIFRNANKIGKWLVTIYVTIIRGTPMMVQAMIIFYGTAFAFPGFQWSNIWNGRILAGIIIVTINTGAYMAETIRSGIQSLDVGQFEAAKSLGFTKWQTMTNIVLPQALRNVLPALGNEFIVNIKDTSVLNVIGVVELFFMSSSVSGATYQFFQTFTITALIYLFLTTIFSLILSYVENHVGQPNERRFFKNITSQTH